MKAAVFHGIGDVRLEDRPLPQIGPDEILLRVLAAGVCMTDVHIVQGHFAVKPPRILGHELAGVVEAVGAQVETSWLARPTGISPARFCGRCWSCRHGAPHLCANFECLGNTHDGGFAEYTVVRADQLVRLDGLSADRAVWMEPLACVLHAIEVADPPDGGTVLIVGAGTLGQLLMRTLRLTHNVRVAVVDPNATKIEAALRSGADAGWVVPRQGSVDVLVDDIAAWHGESLSAIIETSGKAVSLERAIGWATTQTRIVLFGVSDPQARAGISMSDVLGKEIDLTAASGMTPKAFAAASKLLRDERLDVASLVERVIDLDAVPGALDAMTRGSAGKIVIHPA